MPEVYLVALQACALRTDLLRLCLSGLPFSVYKLGNTEFSPAGGVGAFDRRVAGDVISHVLHQLL